MMLGRVGLMVPYDFTRKLIEVCGSANTAWINTPPTCSTPSAAAT